MKGYILILSTLIMLMSSTIVLAAPEGFDSSTQVNASRRTATAASQFPTVAGNITGLNISATSVTQSWAGYYGNITGTITLDDFTGRTMFDWSLASPEGEIFAANNTVSSWPSVVCIDLNEDNGSNLDNIHGMNLTMIEDFFGMARDDVDGFDETFNELDHPQFFIGGVTIAANTCNSTSVYDSSEGKSADWEEVILKDISDNNTLIFASIIEENVDDFTGGTSDYQIIVAEDGHLADTTATTYYFYVELE